MLKTEERLYKASELAEILEVHPHTIYRAKDRGEINYYQIGRSIRFEMPDERTKQCLKQESD